MTIPDRTLEQRRLALAKANEHRQMRSQLKAAIRAGHSEPAHAVQQPPDWAEAMKVYDLLRSVPGMGKVRVQRTMFRLQIAASKTLGGISDRQRVELVTVLRARRRPGQTQKRDAA